MQYQYGIVGAGIVGLATAHALLERHPEATVILFEKEDAVARHQTGHNSGVIHAGVYYAPGSLKARLCREGNVATKSFCERHGLAYQICGKLIVATSAAELARLAGLRERCQANQITVQDVDGAQLQEMEPHISGVAALLVPTTGITDYRAVCAALARDLERRGAKVRCGFEVRRIQEQRAGVLIVASSGEQLLVQRLIACAGLQADRIARLAGIDPGMRIVPFRGEYFRLHTRKSGLLKHLIYPVPDPELPFLGVHLTRMIDGSITVGPNAVLGFARENYAHWGFSLRDAASTLAYGGLWRMLMKHRRSAMAELRSSLSKSLFLQQCRKYCPELAPQDLEAHPAGIRAQAMLADGTLVHDFMLCETVRMLHVLSAPSPAATAAIPIGRMIAEKVTAKS